MSRAVPKIISTEKHSVVFDKPAFHISPNIEARKKKQCKYFFGEK